MAEAISLHSVCQRLNSLDRTAESYAAEFVETLLQSAYQLSASDLHLRPTAEGIDVAIRIDGVLQPCGIFPAGAVSDVVARLKVLSDLLMYKIDVF